MTLLECIGALTVVAVLAAFLVSVAVRQFDRVASEQETASLRALGDALQASILRNRHIPSSADWAQRVADEVGRDIGTVTNNLRDRPRIFLADASGWLATNLPYSQTCAGTPSPPVNARVMLLSSLGAALPMNSGMPSPTHFADLWNASPGTVPASGPWAGWSGRPEDVKIHRVNLSPLFLKLVLGTYAASSNGQFAVDGSALSEAPKNNGVGAYYLQGTLLQLYTAAPSNTLDSTQVLTKDTSFVFEAGVWKNSILGGVPFGVGDIAGIVSAFLAAPPNPSAQYTNMQQALVVQSMTDYMSNYSRWAGGSFSDDSLRDYLRNTVQPRMMSTVQGLYSGAYYPTNGTPCP